MVDSFEDDYGVIHSDNAFAPLAMGAQTWGVIVRDMAGAYSTFANHGVRRQERTFTKVYDSEGNLVIDNVQDQKQILSEKTVNYMNYCLQNATMSGTGTEADFSGMQVAGKTGSTAEYKDRWYCGFTGYYTAAVWTGYDKPEVIRAVSVRNPACVLFRKVMQPLHEGLERKALYDNSKMTTVSVCLDSGKIATDACKKDGRELERISTVRVYPEDVPYGKCDRHVTVELCSGGGLATEWCEKFAEVDDSIEIEESSYVRLTKDEYNAAAKALKRGLDKEYLNEDFVVVSNDEEEIEECKEHTEKSWKKYQKEKEEEEKKKQEEEDKKKQEEEDKKNKDDKKKKTSAFPSNR